MLVHAHLMGYVDLSQASFEPALLKLRAKRIGAERDHLRLFGLERHPDAFHQEGNAITKT